MNINKETIIFTKDELNKIYNESSEERQNLLKELFGEELFKFNYHDIKTYADACEKLGMKEHLFTGSERGDREAQRQAQALYKLLIIQKAINNGVWRDKDGWSYYPYWILYSKEEIECMSEGEKQRKGIRRLLSCANANNSGDSGVRCASVSNRCAGTNTDYGFPWCFNSEEAALYAAKQFESLFFDYYGITAKE